MTLDALASKDFPDLPLSMSTLLALEPEDLRRLLKLGLRRGATDEELSSFFLDAWNSPVDSPSAVMLLEKLRVRGWFRSDGMRWKTRFGSVVGC
jgi:hypothetical protein